MTAYITNYQKKLQFQKCETELIREIKNGASQEKLRLVADKLKATKLGMLKPKFSKE